MPFPIAEVSDKIPTLGMLWFWPMFMLVLVLLFFRNRKFILALFMVLWFSFFGLSVYERFIPVNDVFYEAVLKEKGWFYYWSDCAILLIGALSIGYFLIRQNFNTEPVAGGDRTRWRS